jgi:hypothetical protein
MARPTGPSGQVHAVHQAHMIQATFPLSLHKASFPLSLLSLSPPYTSSSIFLFVFLSFFNPHLKIFVKRQVLVTNFNMAGGKVWNSVSRTSDHAADSPASFPRSCHGFQ